MSLDKTVTSNLSFINQVEVVSLLSGLTAGTEGSCGPEWLR